MNDVSTVQRLTVERSVNCISLVGLEYFILVMRGDNFLTDRELQIRSVEKSSRSVNCIILVGLRIFHSRCEREISFLRSAVQFVRTVNFRYSP